MVYIVVTCRSYEQELVLFVEDMGLRVTIDEVCDIQHRCIVACLNLQSGPKPLYFEPYLLAGIKTK